eukprot:1153536-Pelagomonas_calceolata.AAC.6
MVPACPCLSTLTCTAPQSLNLNPWNPSWPQQAFKVTLQDRACKSKCAPKLARQEGNIAEPVKLSNLTAGAH